MKHFFPLIAMSGLILFVIFIDSSRYLTQQFLAYSQVYFDFGNSSEVNYKTYENITAGIRVKYPSNWNMLETLGNVTLLQSVPTVISGLPGYQITYLIPDNQSDIKQTQAWTFKDNKWYVITYSAQPSAYYSSATAINIINSFVLR